MQDNKINDELESDKSLAIKRRTLTFTSMVLLAFYFTGVEITEINTFIFKFTLPNMDGIKILFLLSAGFLLIRYYSYAYKYIPKAKSEWHAEVLKLPFFFHIHEHLDEHTGYLPERFTQYREPSGDPDNDVGSVLHPRLLVNSKIEVFEYSRHGCVYQRQFYVYWPEQPLLSIRALCVLLEYWLKLQFRERESLNLYSPILLAVFAIGITVWSILAKAFYPPSTTIPRTACWGIFFVAILPSNWLCHNLLNSK